jgi:sigma-B regulation protein RsbU (phosphoserine phosphatase)
MQKKSFREMDEKERVRHSLSSRMFRATLASSLVLGVVMLLVGMSLYMVALTGQYIREACALCNSASAVLVDSADFKRVSYAVRLRYRNLSDDIRVDPETEEYQKSFHEIDLWPEQRRLKNLLKKFRESSSVNDIYIGMYDESRMALLYITDPDESAETGCATGFWEPAETRELHKFLKWDGSGRLYDISYTKKYGLMCTSGVPVKNSTGEIHAFVLADITLDDVVAGMRSFFLEYAFTLIVMTCMIGWFMSRRMENALVAPINSIANAAKRYADDKQNGISKENHFSGLNIHTGDEIENLSLIMADMEKELSAYVENLTQVTAEKERIGTELELAKKIQEDTLPSIFPPFPDRTDFDLYAAMDPAKEVGGDFYDFFLLDKDHLGLVIADVSGKGIPAALFMMISKLLVQNYAKMNLSPGEVLKTVNEQLCSNNQEEMFVTVWLGVLNVKTGILIAANAGHEYPILKRPGKEFEVYHDKHGFVIGGMEGVTYREYKMELEPGTKLFLYTDGVPEAMNEKNELFGLERTLDALNRTADGTPKEILESVQNAIEVYSGSAPQFDDITMLCLVYSGNDQKDRINGRLDREITVDATLENIEVVTSFMDNALNELDCAPKARMQLEVMVDEVFGNIVKYAYPNGSGPVTIRIREELDPKAVMIEFEDAGIPYNPLDKKDPDLSLSAEDRSIGGLGIFLVKKLMDQVDYISRNGKNVLMIRKNI